MQLHFEQHREAKPHQSVVLYLCSSIKLNKMESALISKAQFSELLVDAGD